MDDQTKDVQTSENTVHLQPEQGAEVVVSEETQGEKPTQSVAGDALTPDHPRFKQVIEERNQLKSEIESLKEQMNSLKSDISNRQNETGNLTLTAEEEAQMAQIDKLLKQRGYVKQDDLSAVERMNKRTLTLDRLSDKYNGNNGYPKFDTAEVMAYARERGFSDEQLEQAYKDLHYQSIIRVEAEKLARTHVPDSEKPTGQDRQFDAQYNRGSIESMNINDYEKNRDSIMARFKRSVVNRSRLDL